VSFASERKELPIPGKSREKWYEETRAKKLALFEQQRQRAQIQTQDPQRLRVKPIMQDSELELSLSKLLQSQEKPKKVTECLMEPEAEMPGDNDSDRRTEEDEFFSEGHLQPG
jgi:uncharacterized protein YdaT